MNSNAETLQILREQLAEAIKIRDNASEAFRKDPAAGFIYQGELIKAHFAARYASIDSELLTLAISALETMHYDKKVWAPSLRVVERLINEATNAEQKPVEPKTEKSPKVKNCRNCKWAQWQTSPAGRRNFNYRGDCVFPVESIALPLSRKAAGELLTRGAQVAEYSDKPINCPGWEKVAT